MKPPKAIITRPTGNTLLDKFQRDVVDVIKTIDTTPTSDLWTYLKITSKFTTTNTSATRVTGLLFTPESNKIYEIRGFFSLRTATATEGAQLGLVWPAGYTNGCARLTVGDSASTVVISQGSAGTTLLVSTTGLPDTTGSWPAEISASLVVGSSPSGVFQITLQSEAGAPVSVEPGSFIKYKVI